MEKFVDSIYGVITFYVIVTILSLAVAYKIKQEQVKSEYNETYVAYVETASYDL